MHNALFHSLCLTNFLNVINLRILRQINKEPYDESTYSTYNCIIDIYLIRVYNE